MTDNVIHCESSARHHYTILYYIYIVYNRDRTHAFFFGRFWNCFVADGFQFWLDLEGHCMLHVWWERLGLRYSLERRSSWCFWLSGWGTKELEGLVGLGGDATDVRHQQWFGRRVRGAHTGQVLISWYFHVFPIRAKAKHDIWTLSSPQVGCRWRVRSMVLVVNGCKW